MPSHDAVKIERVSDDRSDAGQVLLGSLLYAAGSAILYVLPAYLGELSSQLGVNEAQMGSVTAAENIGIALASILSMFWLTRFDRRTVAATGAVFCVLFNLTAFFSRSFDWLVVTRFLTGLLGEGILFSLAFSVLGSSRDPDRSFGIGLTTVVMFGSVVLGTSTYLDRVPHGTGALLPLAILPLAIFVALKWMPRDAPASASRESDRAAPPTRRLAMLAIGGMAIWFAAPGAFWTFAESAAVARKIPGETISIALAVGNAAGLLGSVMAAWQGDRWGRLWPITIASGLLCLSVVLYGHCTNAVALASALSAFNIFWNYATVYEMALVVALDPAGRAAVGIPAAQVIGFAAGGFFSGLVITGASYAALPVVVSMFAAGGLLALAPCLWTIKRRPPQD
jgi:predicted MFS family arabinose efflux permease